MNQFVANGRADQVADCFDTRCGIVQFPARPLGGFIISEFAIFFIRDDPARMLGMLFRLAALVV